MEETILILGAGGQIGSELIIKLGEIYGNNNVIASDVRHSEKMDKDIFPFEIVDAKDKEAIIQL